MFEEEDFDPRDYGYVLTPDVVNTKACFMLKEAEDELNKQVKANPGGTEVLSCFYELKFWICELLIN